MEGAFIQGVGFFTNEEYKTNTDGMVIHDGTWTYKIPTVDTIPKQFNVELINSAGDRKRVLSSKGKPTLTLGMSHLLGHPWFLQTFLNLLRTYVQKILQLEITIPA